MREEQTYKVCLARTSLHQRAVPPQKTNTCTWGPEGQVWSSEWEAWQAEGPSTLVKRLHGPSVSMTGSEAYASMGSLKGRIGHVIWGPSAKENVKND